VLTNSCNFFGTVIFIKQIQNTIFMLKKTIKAGIMGLASLALLGTGVSGYAQQASDNSDVQLGVEIGYLEVFIDYDGQGMAGAGNLGTYNFNSGASVQCGPDEFTASVTLPYVTTIDSTGSGAGYSSTYRVTNLRGQTDNAKFLYLATETAPDDATATDTTSTQALLKATNASAGVVVHDSPHPGTNFEMPNSGTAVPVSTLSDFTVAGETNAFDYIQTATGLAGEGIVHGGANSIKLDLVGPQFCVYDGDAAIDGNNITTQTYKGTLTIDIV
jgi:hypothetical protein